MSLLGMKTHKQLIQERDRRAEQLGEGAWRNKTTNEWCRVDVTFHPRPKLWITEDGWRRATSNLELSNSYEQLKL